LVESPLAFASSPEDDVASSVEAVGELLRRSPESVVIGAFQKYLIGAVGLYRDRHLKSSHKAHLWGMYVMPGQRRQGVGSELLDAALRHARALSAFRGSTCASPPPRPGHNDCTSGRDSVSGARNSTPSATMVRRLSTTTWPSSSNRALSDR
jgi:GNAT superfamily N-acetyltransferase